MIALYKEENEEEFILVPEEILILESNMFDPYTHLSLKQALGDKTVCYIMAINNELADGYMTYRVLINAQYIKCTYSQFQKMKAFV